MTFHKMIVTEKPSVAAVLAKVVGADTKENGFFSGNGYLVSWCLGHLVELAAPDAYNPDYSKWALKDLPIIPTNWQTVVKPDTEKQFNVLTGLLHRADVEEVICATDPGREGELIFRFVYLKSGCNKPFRRLWVSSMEESALADGLAHLRDGADYDGLYNAALCRAEADWLVGMNATRLYTLLYDCTLNVGRVVSPTLALLVRREQEIAAFKAEPFYTVVLDCGAFLAESVRFKTRAEADNLWSFCMDSAAMVMDVQTEDKAVRPPKLYDLTALQRDANRLFGYSAKKTLEGAQSLYEQKLCTYPRTDSRYLTEDFRDTLPELAGKIAARLPFMAGVPLPVNAARVIDGKKVTDHHALIPTQTFLAADLGALPSIERNLLALIAVRLLCAVGEPHRYSETAVTLTCADQPFTTKGRTVLDEGWRAVMRAYYAALPNPKKSKELPALPELRKNDTLRIKAAVHQGKSEPPRHYTEDTLLQAMERAGAADFAADAERKGLGTSATRADTIEKLLSAKAGLAVRDNRNLIPTEKGALLIGVLPEALTSVKLTSDWEEKLAQVARGELPARDFMGGILSMTAELVQDAHAPESSPFPQSHGPVGVCPWCGEPVYEGKKSFFCSAFKETGCRFALWKDNGFFKAVGKQLTRNMASALLKDGRVHMRSFRSQKTGKRYDADVLLSEGTTKNGLRCARFKMDFPKRRRG